LCIHLPLVLQPACMVMFPATKAHWLEEMWPVRPSRASPRLSAATARPRPAMASSPAWRPSTPTGTVWRPSRSPGRRSWPANPMKVSNQGKGSWVEEPHRLLFPLPGGRWGRNLIRALWGLNEQVSRPTSMPNLPRGPGRLQPRPQPSSASTRRRSACPTPPPFRTAASATPAGRASVSSAAEADMTAQGWKECETCEGKKQLLTYIKLKVEWVNHVEDHVENQMSGLDPDNLRSVHGKKLFENSQYLAISQASERLVREHQSKYAQSSRILQQVSV
ncbi:unnamed protein product, partial [Tetraodon nigroviridis]